MFSIVAPGYCGTHAKRLAPSPDGASVKNGFDAAGALDLAGTVDRLYWTTNTANATSTALIITRSSGLVFLGGRAVIPATPMISASVRSLAEWSALSWETTLS